MEACATAHYWARELRALGHEVRLMPPQYVKAYLKRNKNDAADAEAICEAVKRPSMRFVPVKTKEQQSALLMHRGRELLVRQRTMLANALRGH
jgi:transposase